MEGSRREGNGGSRRIKDEIKKDWVFMQAVTLCDIFLVHFCNSVDYTLFQLTSTSWIRILASMAVVVIPSDQWINVR